MNIWVFLVGVGYSSGLRLRSGKLADLERPGTNADTQESHGLASLYNSLASEYNEYVFGDSSSYEEVQFASQKTKTRSKARALSGSRNMRSDFLPINTEAIVALLSQCVFQNGHMNPDIGGEQLECYPNCHVEPQHAECWGCQAPISGRYASWHSIGEMVECNQASDSGRADETGYVDGIDRTVEIGIHRAVGCHYHMFDWLNGTSMIAPTIGLCLPSWTNGGVPFPCLRGMGDDQCECMRSKSDCARNIGCRWSATGFTGAAVDTKCARRCASGMIGNGPAIEENARASWETECISRKSPYSNEIDCMICKGEYCEMKAFCECMMFDHDESGCKNKKYYVDNDGPFICTWVCEHGCDGDVSNFEGFEGDEGGYSGYGCYGEHELYSHWGEACKEGGFEYDGYYCELVQNFYDNYFVKQSVDTIENSVVLNVDFIALLLKGIENIVVVPVSTLYFVQESRVTGGFGDPYGFFAKQELQGFVNQGLRLDNPNCAPCFQWRYGTFYDKGRRCSQDVDVSKLERCGGGSEMDGRSGKPRNQYSRRAGQWRAMDSSAARMRRLPLLVLHCNEQRPDRDPGEQLGQPPGRVRGRRGPRRCRKRCLSFIRPV